MTLSASETTRRPLSGWWLIQGYEENSEPLLDAVAGGLRTCSTTDGTLETNSTSYQGAESNFGDCVLSRSK